MKNNPYNYSEKDKVMTCKLEAEFFSPFDDTKFAIYGKDTLIKTENFRRFSDEEIEKIKNVSADVAFLAKQPVGVQLRFITDSRVIRLKVKMSGKFDMGNVTFMNQCGFDLYEYNEEKGYYVFHNVSWPSTKTEPEYQADIGDFRFKKIRKLILNFPMFIEVCDLLIGFEKDSFIEPSYIKNENRIMIYGTSIVHGGCVARPGMNISNYLSRHYDCEVLNYGFSGAALLEPEVASIISKRQKIDLFIVDAEANAGCDHWMKDNIVKFMDEFYKYHKDCKVIVMNKIHMGIDDIWERNNIMKNYNDYLLKKVVRKYKKEGKNIIFVNNYNIFEGNYSEYTVDGVHPTDLGMMQLIKNYIKSIDKIRRI